MGFFPFRQPLAKQDTLSLDLQTWNRLIDYISRTELCDLTDTQASFALIFWYDAEVNRSGHSAYFDIYADIQPAQLAQALATVGASAIIANFYQASRYGAEDDCAQTDCVFASFQPCLTDILYAFVLLRADECIPPQNNT